MYLAPTVYCILFSVFCIMIAMRALSSRNLRGSSGGSHNSPPRFNSAGARYDVLDRAGEGTLFVTYRVRDKDTDRVVALKALKNAFSKHLQFAPVLTQGASRMLGLQHPHVAHLHEIGEEEGTTFLVTQWLAGQSLEARLRRAPFGRIEALTSTRQIAEGLKFLHDHGIVHGDLRPRQVLGDGDGLLNINDAGTSGAFSAAGLSIADVQQDSIYYLAPERTVPNAYGDAPATIGSDMYALGAILYRMLSGRVPFAGPSPVAVALRHRHDEPLPPSCYNLQCPPDLEEIALRLLAKNPAERFSSAQEVLDALEPQQTAPITPVAVAPIAAAPDVSTPALFPPNLPISAIAATPLSQLPVPVAASTVAASAVANTAAPVAVAATAISTVAVANSAASNAAKMSVNPMPPNQTPANSPTSSTRSAAPIANAPLQQTASPAVLDEKKARKKQRGRELLGALLALTWVFIGVGIFIGIFYGAYHMWTTSAPKDVRVPTYIGLNQVNAKKALSRAGLTLTVRGEVFDPKRAAGTIVAGDPRPGRVVKAGRVVAVTISRGAEQTAMPDLSDLDVQRARQILSRSGMKIGNVTEIYHDRVARGYICGQFPLAGEAFSRSEPINLVISRGPQPSGETQASSDLLPPPPPPSTSTSTEDNPLTVAPNSTPSNNATMVSRTVLIRVPVPAKSGATSRTVKIMVRDADGDHTIYSESHAPGELIDEYVRVTRPQGSSATVSVYIDGELQKQQKV